MADASSTAKKIKDEDIKFVDLRFTDARGKMQHVTMDASLMDEEAFAEGVMFDGSSIAGWKDISQSDMALLPDPDSVHIDPFFAQTTIGIFCDVIEPTTGELYERDPRAIARIVEPADQHAAARQRFGGGRRHIHQHASPARLQTGIAFLVGPFQRQAAFAQHVVGQVPHPDQCIKARDAGRSVRHPVELKTLLRPLRTAFDQSHRLVAHVVAHIHQKLDAVIDRAQRVDQFMAQMRAEQAEHAHIDKFGHWRYGPPSMSVSLEQSANFKRTYAMTQGLAPGNFVRHPDRPDWGLGQVQSVSAGRATVNFEHAGKRTIILSFVALVPASPGDGDQN